MLDRFDPPGVPKPASRYAQAILHPAGARRLVISGQIGVTEDGQVVAGLEAQVQQAFANLITIVRAAGGGPEHVVKIGVFMVAPGDVALYRAVRDAAFQGHRPASTYLVVAGLASPDLLFEVEGEAVLP